MKEILSYTEDLKQNNNREWFNAHKTRYEKLTKEFSSTIQEIIDRMQLADPSLSGLKAGDCIFRIYRDIRFSKDKTPYKTHFSAYIARGGRKRKAAGYYVHISNEESFIGAGVYQPEKEDLNAIRHEILYQPETFSSLLSSNESAGFKLMEEDKLKTGPKDFPKDSPYIEYLKYRHFIAMKNFSREELTNGNFAERVAGHLTDVAPFTAFLNTAMEYKGNQ